MAKAEVHEGCGTYIWNIDSETCEAALGQGEGRSVYNLLFSLKNVEGAILKGVVFPHHTATPKKDS